MKTLLEKRINATTIDLGIIWFLNYFFVTNIMIFLKLTILSFPVKLQMQLLSKISAYHSLSMVVTAFTYFSLFYLLTNGQTLGKSIFKIAVTSDDEGEIKTWQCLLRPIIYYLSVMLFPLTLLCIIISKEHKTPADILTATHIGYTEIKPVHEFQLILLDRIEDDEELEEKKKAS